jgi:tape measure domain-containing protein
MAVVEELVTVFRLQDRYTPQLNAMKSATQSFFGSVRGGVNTLENLGKAFAVAGGAASAFLVGAGIAAADFDAKVKGLEAYAGSAENLAYQLGRLKEAAKLPGLGFEEAIVGATKLEAAGLSFSTAERAIRGFGNALALVGGGRDDLNGVLLALTQMASMSQVSAEEINQIAQRVPQIRSILKSAFGTADTQKIQDMGIAPIAAIERMLPFLLKLPTAANSAKNSFENLGSTMSQAFITIGRAANEWLVPAADQLGKLIDYANDSGILKMVGQGVMNAFTGGQGAPQADAFVRPFAMIASRLVFLGDYIKLFKNSISIFIDVWKIGVDVLDIGMQDLARKLSPREWFAEAPRGIFYGDQIGLAQAAMVTMASAGSNKLGYDNLNDKATDLENSIVKGFQDSQKNDKGASAFDPGGDQSPLNPVVQTATNTAKMVQLQQKQVDISRQILGGAGTVGGDAASPVRINQALGGGGSSKLNYHLQQVVHEILRQSSTQQMAIQVNSGVPNRYATR